MHVSAGVGLYAGRLFDGEWRCRAVVHDTSPRSRAHPLLKVIRQRSEISHEDIGTRAPTARGDTALPKENVLAATRDLSFAAARPDTFGYLSIRNVREMFREI